MEDGRNQRSRSGGAVSSCTLIWTEPSVVPVFKEKERGGKTRGFRGRDVTTVLKGKGTNKLLKYFLCGNVMVKVLSLFLNLVLKLHMFHSYWFPSLMSLLGFICSRFLDSLSRALDSYLPRMSGFELLKTVYHQCLLGHFPSAPLQQLLQSSTLEQFKAIGKTCLFLPCTFIFSSSIFFLSATSLSHIIHLNFLCFSSAPRFLRNQDRMFQTVDLCLRLDHPPLPMPLTVPPFLLGDPVPSSPSAKPWLSQCLRSVLEDHADTTLQDMVFVENSYLIGKDRLLEDRSSCL